MKRILLSAIVLALCYIAGAQTIHLLGDSTMSPKNLEGGNIERGWGMILPTFLDDSIKVINYARGGRSTKSTIDSGRWEECKSKMKKGDYLFMQFGHNDKKIEDPGRYAAPFGAYQENLRLFCRTAMEMGVTPVILTPMYRRWFNEGVLDPNCHGDYPKAAKQVAEELDVVLIDMTDITYHWLIETGEEASKSYFCWFEAGKYECHPAERKDNTHFSLKGAKKMAELVCGTFPELLPELAKHLVHYDVVIAADGSGDYFTIQEAMEAMPDTLCNGSIKILVRQGAAKGTAALISSCTESEPLSIKMVESEMARCRTAKFLDFQDGSHISWNYTPGLEQKAFLDVYDRYGDTTLFNYVETWYDEAIQEDGKPQSYKVSAYNVDKICPGKTLFQLYDNTLKNKYRMAMDTLMFQYLSHPRTSQGALWHKNVYPHQVWLDGLYMAQPFAAEYAARYMGGEMQSNMFADIIRDFEVTRKQTYDPRTGLYRHAWDESRQMFWCDPQTGQSQHCWCRALGWTAMAIVEVLDWIPEGTKDREALIDWLSEIVSKLPQYSDPKTGMWFQVMDQPGREGNYVEATGSAMFIYAMLKGYRKGYLGKDVKIFAVKSYERFLKTFISYDENGLMNINQCCSVGGLGGKQNRMGDFAYYLSEPIRSNDPKGVGPFIWASLEYENMK